MTTEETIGKHVEVETKYRVEPQTMTEFKRIVSQMAGLEKFIYVEGPDYYFTNGKGDSFIRYRRPSHGLDNGRSEITVKVKPEGAKNNIIRTEVNVRVDQTDEDAIRAFVGLMGYRPNFSILKTCHIYNLSDATLVFYSVYDTTDGKSSKVDSFVEIEVSEEHVQNMTEDQAWDIIKKYEKALEEVGVNPQKRIRKSLFEMYRREGK